MQKVAEESRSIEYRNDTVIDNNLLQTDMVYVLISVSGNLFIISFDRWNFFIWFVCVHKKLNPGIWHDQNLTYIIHRHAFDFNQDKI